MNLTSLSVGELAMKRWGDEGAEMAGLTGLIMIFVVLLVVLP